MTDKRLKNFSVENSDRISAFCVTNGDYSVVLKRENEAFMVCNMLNRRVSDLND